TARNSVSASITQLSKAGAVVDAAVGAGANQVSGPSLTRGDTNALYRLALRAAIANALLKARAIAVAGHVRLGPIKTVTESSASPPPQPLGAQAGAPASKQTPIQPGTQLVEADVVVTFALG